MASLHIMHGDPTEDKQELETAAKERRRVSTWIVPRAARIGDEVFINISQLGFFASARINTVPKKRSNWKNRYGSALDSVKLIEPPIPLSIVRKCVLQFTWVEYPRSITTPLENVAERLRKLVFDPKARILVLDDQTFAKTDIEQLRKIALLKARPFATKKERKVIFRARSKAIRLYVLARAQGHCEGCHTAAPFHNLDRSPYLEPHHVMRLADDGPDHPAKVIALCPNCHRRAHYSRDAKLFNSSLIRSLAKIEP